MFYDRFVELCNEINISPSIVAETIGLNRSSVTFWKRGSTPKGETLRKLANYFGVSVDYLLGTCFGSKMRLVASACQKVTPSFIEYENG